MNGIAKEIYDAASYGDIEATRRLLKSATFEDLIYKNPHDLHKTAVMVAAYHGHTEIVRAIFSHSIASVHIQDEAGWTALMFAAYKGHTATVNAILMHPEVDINVQNNHGWTALMMAAAEGRPASVRALLTRADIDVNLQNNQDGGTALLLACIRGYTEIVRDILSVKGVLVSLEDNEGRLPVFAAKNDEITALINFYDPEVGLVYPVHDLPAPPTHTVALMPPLPPSNEPQLALSVDFTELAEQVHALLPLLPSICVRGQWHRNRIALQRKMEAAVHIHHHKEAALIGRELLAFKATTASTPALRALSENDYLHLPDKVALLLQRAHKLCEKLALAQDFDTLDQAAVLVVGLEQVQVAMAQSQDDAPIKNTAAAATTPTSSSTPEAVSEHPHLVHFAEQAVVIDAKGTGVDVVKVTDEVHEVGVLDGASGVVSGSVHLHREGSASGSSLGSSTNGSVSGGGSGDEEEHHVRFGDKAVVIDSTGTGVAVVEITDEPREVHVLEGVTGPVSGSVPVHHAAESAVSGGAVMPPPPPNTPSHGLLAGKKGAAGTITTTSTSTDAHLPPPPPPRATTTVTADPENHYLPQYTAYSDTVPQGAYGVHTLHTALEALAASHAQVEKLLQENESLKQLNRTLSGKREDFNDDNEGVKNDSEGVLMPPPPPSV